MPERPVASPADVAVLIGRFQPFHRGHQGLLLQALAVAEHVVVVIGSAFQARTPRNPFTWQERAAMIADSLPEVLRARVAYLPMRDWYDEHRWRESVRQGVADLVRARVPDHPARITVIGEAEAEGAALAHANGWPLRAIARSDAIDATSIRDTCFGAEGAGLMAALASLREDLPEGTWRFLQTWTATPACAALRQEWRMLQAYRAAWSAAPYPPVFVTVDAVLRCADKVLLIQRGQPPGVGLYAVPGGFIEQRETAYQSALRELREETRLALPAAVMLAALRDRAVFDHPDRSQRGRTITHAFYFDLGAGPLPEVQADDDAQAVEWVDITQLLQMEDRFHDDHFHMLDHFLGLL